MKSIEWLGGKVRFIDQTKLPAEEIAVMTDDLVVIKEAIRSLRIRGAPALGVAAAYGVLLGTQQLQVASAGELLRAVERVASEIGQTRPTARNLFRALERMCAVCRLNSSDTVERLRAKLVDEAAKIHEEDRRMCEAIGAQGAELVGNPATILTHCNTGALATGGEGTAQSIITTAFDQGKKISVYVDETRPLLQGARLTAWELQKKQVPVTLITDNTAAVVMARKGVDLVVVGADRIAANGDVANKVGTYGLAILAKHHGVPFYVAAPTSTIDLPTAKGNDIPIEERNASEVTDGFGRSIAPRGTAVFSPAFDITPYPLITAIVTEQGVLHPPFAESLKAAVEQSRVEYR